MNDDDDDDDDNDNNDDDYDDDEEDDYRPKVLAKSFLLLPTLCGILACAQRIATIRSLRLSRRKKALRGMSQEITSQNGSKRTLGQGDA
eukprot:229636-Amphidinium_carterae.2